ncbi:MAG: CapA family protein, partial [Caldanaerobacter sp.]
MGKKGFVAKALFFLLIVGVLMVFFKVSVDKGASKAVVLEQEENLLPAKENKNLGEEKVSQDIEIVLSAVGDCTLGSDEKYSRYGSFDEELKKQNYDYSYFFKDVRPIFEKSDLVIANLEGPLTTSKERADKEFAFKGDPSYAKILKEGKIDAVNLANNHSFDYGKQGFYDTVKALKKEGIGFFGYGYNYITEAKGVKIGVLGYTGYDDTSETKQMIKKDIEKMRQTVDILVVSFHWGEENKYYPNKVQINLGHFSIDKGADVVVGHHPHVLQGI